MVLGKQYSETTARLNLKQPCPFFNAWARRLTVCNDTVVSTVDLHMEYLSYVKIKVNFSDSCHEKEIPDEVKLATKNRFADKMAIHALSTGINSGTRKDGRRGYRVQVKKNDRGLQPPEAKRRRSARQNAATPEPEVDLPLYKRLNCGKDKGMGCYAAQDLEAKQIICEYDGEIISPELAVSREKEYALQEKPMTMVCVGQGAPKYCIDAHRDKAGRLFTDTENPARLFNHKRYNPNLQLITVGAGADKRHYLQTTRPVAAGIELKWNYQDKSKEGWLNE